MRKLIFALALLCASPALVQPSLAQSPDPTAQERAEARALYAHIVNTNTSVSGGQTPQLAAWLRDQFTTAGFPASDILIAPYEQTAGLVLRYRGDGSAHKKPILFMGHMDVVEAKRED